MLVKPDDPNNQAARNIRLLQNINTYGDLLPRWMYESGCPKEVLKLGFHQSTWLSWLSCRSGRAWCPNCLNEAAYERVLWTLKDYVFCAEHQTPLESFCWSCGWTANLASSHAHVPGACNACGAYQGREVRGSAPDPWSEFCSTALEAWVKAYQETDHLKPPWPIKSVAPGGSPMSYLLIWSWLTGRSIVSGERVRQPQEPQVFDKELARALVIMDDSGAPDLGYLVEKARQMTKRPPRQLIPIDTLPRAVISE